MLNPKLNKTLKSKAQTNSKIFSVINLDPMIAKKVDINITELNIIINSIKEEKITSFGVRCIILIKFLW